MEREFLQLAIWDQFSPREAEAVARALGRALPGPWQLEAVEEHACGDQRRQVAFYRWPDGARFALVPGDDVALGDEHGRPLRPGLQERRDWLDEYGEPDWPEEFDSDEEEDAFYEDEQYREYCRWSDFFAWLSRLPGPRSVPLAPFLIETWPRTCGDLAPGAMFRELTATVAAGGLRLATSDEWEHACAGGSRTVWRWGDFCPDYCHDDEGDDLVHWQPNAFGLRYRGSLGELVAEEGVRRNTDGGVALCGGHGFPCGWLSLASANVRDYYALGWDRPDQPLPEWWGLRRAFSPPAEALD
jgi:hypothetical protein